MNPTLGCSRRDFLRNTACGFGQVALAGLLTERGVAATSANPLAPKMGHFPARAKRVIFLFMQGGPSHVDTFDHKPTLDKYDGQPRAFDDARALANTGARGTSQRVMKSLWKFNQYGECGRWVSDLFPHTAQHVDDLCVVRSLHTEGISHGPATLMLHCGSSVFVRPSFGSWITYGLGSENENLPGFVSIGPSAGNGGPRNYGTAFLPAAYQGTALGKAGAPARDATIRNLVGMELTQPMQRQQLDLIGQLNAEQVRARVGEARRKVVDPTASELEAVISSYELAWRMEQVAPAVLDIDHETRETHALYGIGEKETDNYGRQCLLARRMCESGVRYIQVTYGDSTANPAWDQHSDLPKHAFHAKAVDRPIAGLLTDLKRRGLLDDTIVWWGGEFGRTPYAQGNGTGRDHNPRGFTMWMAGGGFRPGLAYGQTDDWGMMAVEDKVHMHDLHATILNQLGIDHERLTYRYAGRNYRMTDVSGRIVREILT
jgi:hypothetical protein